jgi:hypothetical protein
MLGELVVRYERKVEMCHAFMIVALIVIWLRAYLEEKLQPCTNVPLQKHRLFHGLAEKLG